MLKLRLAVITLIYGAMFHYAYVAYIHPSFEYAHYYYIATSSAQLLLTYLLVTAPVVAYRSSTAPATCGAALIFVVCYVPAQLMLLFNLERSPAELALVQGSLAASMAMLLWASSIGGRAGAPIWPVDRLSVILNFLTVVSIGALVLNYYKYMRLVSFEDVYDLRFESSIEQSVVANYLISWLAYCFLPFYFARGLLRKRWGDIGIGLIGSLLIYSATGAKAAILMLPIVCCLNVLMGSGRNFLLRLMIAMTVVIFLVIALIPDEGILMWIKSILMVRVLGTGGWTIATYYEYFSTHSFTFFTHIGPINALTGAYPYGEYSLGQTIGLNYTGSSQANFNANFWASDGFAALGVLGIPVVTVAMTGVFYAINRIASGCPPRFVALWLTGFWLAVMNVPLTTALLSGGGGLTMLLLWSTRARLGGMKRHHARSAAAPSGVAAGATTGGTRTLT